MATPKPRIKVPKSVSAGEAFEIKTLISHKMDSGRAKDKKGNLIPRKIIHHFACKVDGMEAFAMDLEPAISANPFISFDLKLDKTSELEFAWTDDDGSVYSKKSTVKVA